MRLMREQKKLRKSVENDIQGGIVLVMESTITNGQHKFGLKDLHFQLKVSYCTN